MEKIIEYIQNRIKELYKADADFCKDRWDMSKPEYERNLAREMSNQVTATRQELERALKYLTSLAAPPDGKEEEKMNRIKQIARDLIIAIEELKLLP